MSDDQLPQALQTNANDRVQSALRAVTSAIDLLSPGVGSVFGELISVILPANREERIAQFVACLDAKVRHLGERLEDLMASMDAEQTALVEDGLRASARATSNDRIEKLSSLVATGLTECQTAIRQREMLDLLGRLADFDIVNFAYFLNRHGKDSLRVPLLSWADHDRMSAEEKTALEERDRLRELSLTKLIGAGVLEQKYQLARKGIRGDEMVVAEGEVRLSRLGYFFAMHLGLWPDDAHIPFFGD